MLPVQTWPPSTPGSLLAPFGPPMTVDVGSQPPWGFILPKGAWYVQTSSNQVFFTASGVTWANPVRAPGTGFLPGQIPAPPPPPCPGVTPPIPVSSCGCGCGNLTWAWAPNWANPPAPGSPASTPPTSPPPWTWMTWEDFIEAFGEAPPAGSQPPNWFGWYCVTPVMSMTLIGGNSSGLVVADGQNVSIQGSGSAIIVEALNV